MNERKRTKAEEDAAYHRLAYRIERLIQRQKRKISRQVIDGGCVVLQPALFSVLRESPLRDSDPDSDPGDGTAGKQNAPGCLNQTHHKLPRGNQ